MTVEQMAGIGHASQGGLYALLPMLVLLPFYLMGWRREGVGWRAVRALEHLCFAVFGIGVLGMTAGEIPCATIKARSVACLSNMKELALGVSMYVQDSDEHYPPADRWGDLARSQSGGHITRDTLRCPNSASPYGYGFNRAFDRIGLDKVPYPADAVTVFEADAASPNVSGGRDTLSPKPRHSGGRNYGFADGHVKFGNEWTEARLGWDPLKPPPDTKGNP